MDLGYVFSDDKFVPRNTLSCASHWLGFVVFFVVCLFLCLTKTKLGIAPAFEILILFYFYFNKNFYSLIFGVLSCLGGPRVAQLGIICLLYGFSCSWLVFSSSGLLPTSEGWPIACPFLNSSKTMWRGNVY